MKGKSSKEGGVGMLFQEQTKISCFLLSLSFFPFLQYFSSEKIIVLKASNVLCVFCLLQWLKREPWVMEYHYNILDTPDIFVQTQLRERPAQRTEPVLSSKSSLPSPCSFTQPSACLWNPSFVFLFQFLPLISPCFSTLPFFPPPLRGTQCSRTKQFAKEMVQV